MTAQRRLAEGAKSAAVSAAFTLIPIGRLRGRPLAFTSLGVGAVLAGTVAVAAVRSADDGQEGDVPEAPGKGSPARRRSVAAAAAAASGTLVGGGLWLSCFLDRVEEDWLRRRGVKRPRSWMVMAAAVLGGLSGALERPDEDRADGSGADTARHD